MKSTSTANRIPYSIKKNMLVTLLMVVPSLSPYVQTQSTKGSALSTDICPSWLQNDKYTKAFGNSCFKFYTSSGLDYFDARQVCIRKNGTLALPKTKEVNAFLSKQLVQYGVTKDTWIGLNDDEVEDHFFWEDRTPLMWDNFAKGEGHDNYIFVEDWEDCVAIKPKDGSWHDYHCDTTLFGLVDEHKPFVCQFAAGPGHHNAGSTTSSPSVASSTCPTIECQLDCGMLGFKQDNNHCLVCECDTAN